MAIQIGGRPAQLDGCWKTWQESDLDVVIRTDMDQGNMKSRRRFTGIGRHVVATVTLPASLHSVFIDWFRINQRQGTKATPVKTPYGTEENFQWIKPPAVTWNDKNAFTATVEMLRGAGFP